eukprot:COSAG02_NODE_144_length_34086_cov_65.390944_30_plen_86_part_00
MLQSSLAPLVPVQAHVGAAGDRDDAEQPCYVPHSAGVRRLGADGRLETTSQASKCIRRDSDTGGTTVQAARTLSMTQESESIDYD